MGLPLADALRRAGFAGEAELVAASAVTATTLTITPDGNMQITAHSSDVRGVLTPQALDLSAFVGSLRDSSQLHVLLLDPEARLLYHSDAEHVNFDPAAVFTQQPGMTGTLRGASGSVFVADPDRVEWVVAYAPVPDTSWGLVVAETWAHVVNPLLSTSLLTLLVLIPAVLIAVRAVVFGVRRVIRPLQLRSSRRDSGLLRTLPLLSPCR